MSKGNKSARRELERLYGKECFIDKLHLREIYGNEGKKYTGKSQAKKVIMRSQQKKQASQLTYHHMVERSKGGQATVENGALLSAQNHQWFNEQPKLIQEKMNDEFRKYKAECDAARECDFPMSVDFVEMTIEGIKRYHQMTFDELGVETITIDLKDNEPEDEAFLELSDEEQAEYNRHKEERRKRVYSRFPKRNDALDTSIPRGKAQIDAEWQREIMNDVLDELRY